jgi:hypothetical protein
VGGGGGARVGYGGDQGIRRGGGGVESYSYEVDGDICICVVLGPFFATCLHFACSLIDLLTLPYAIPVLYLYQREL